MIVLTIISIIKDLLNYWDDMAQIKLELKKEIYIPYKVIVVMEEEPGYNAKYPDYNNYDDDYYLGQHWKKEFK